MDDDILTKISENNIFFSLVRSHLLCFWILFEFNDKICVSMKTVSSFLFSSWGIHGKHFPSFKLEDDHSHRFVDRLCYRRSINDNFNSIKQLNIMTSKNKCCVSFYVRKTYFVNGVNCSRQQERNPIKLPNTLSNLKYFQARFLVFNFFMLFWQPEWVPSGLHWYQCKTCGSQYFLQFSLRMVAWKADENTRKRACIKVI